MIFNSNQINGRLNANSHVPSAPSSPRSYRDIRDQRVIPGAIEKPRNANPKTFGQAIHLLTKHWSSEMDQYDAEIQEMEHRSFNNNDIKTHGIHRRVFLSYDPDTDNYRPSDVKTEMNQITTAQPFSAKYIKALFSNMHVVFIGDSLVRALYKDMVALIDTVNGILVPDELIKKRLEPTFCNDHLLDYDDPDDKTAFVEFREYIKDDQWIQYLFTTRIYNDRVEQLLAHFEKDPPDVVVIHSNVWDSTRYSDDDRINLTQFSLRLSYLCQRLKAILEPTAVVIFVIMPPAAYEQSTERAIKKGFFGFFLENKMKEMNRVACLTSSAISYFAAQIMNSYGFDVLDLNYHFQQDLFAALRAHDGLHYVSLGVRIMSQTLIGHIVKAWDIDLPDEIAENLERLRADFFDHRSDKLNGTTISTVNDFLGNVPSCYNRIFKLGQEMYKEIKEENSRTPKLIEHYRAKLLQDMRAVVKDPFLKRYVLDLKNLYKIRSLKLLPSTSTAVRSTIRPILKPSKRPIEDQTLDQIDMSKFANLTDEEREIIIKGHTDDAIWNEIMFSYVSLASRTLNRAMANLNIREVQRRVIVPDKHVRRTIGKIFEESNPNVI